MKDASDQLTADLRRARERVAALGDVLRVIRDSRGDPAPVFNVILESACRLCEVPNAALYLIEETRTEIELIAHRGARPAYLETGLTVWPLDSTASIAVAVREGRVVHAEDLADTAAYCDGDPLRRAAVDVEGMRTYLAVPLISNGRAIGCIGLFRRQVQAFTADQIDLIGTFAAQAVIAIENVRQFCELQARLEREAATRQILEVISQSRDDEEPVFNVILENARRLCETPVGAVVLGREGGGPQELVADHGGSEASRELYRTGQYTMDPESSIVARAIIERRTIHLEDMAKTDAYRQGDPRFRTLVDGAGIRTNMFVPLISQGEGIGCLLLYRHEVRPFTADQITLVETFAAQAVIAIENVRQFRELQARLEREKATREILEVISRSRADEQPVFEVILKNAARLCNSTMARLHLVEEEGRHRRLAAHWGEELRSLEVGETMPMDGGHPISLTILESRTIHTDDLAATELYRQGDPLFRRLVDQEGLRTLLTVPLLRGSEAFGCIALSRREKVAFGGDEIALIETFAAQAVIAIENVRQFRELQTRLEHEAATREILEVISRSRDDQQPVFEVILRNAARLCGSPMARLELADEARTTFRCVANWGEEMRSFQIGETMPLDLPNDLPTAIREGEVRHIHDLAESDLYLAGDPIRVRMVEEEGYRTYLIVPLISKGVGIGGIVLCRREVDPFAEAEIALVQTFAAQAMIAIENVRQFRDLQTRLEREAATREILQVISRSRDDEKPVFDTILECATRLIGSPLAGLHMLDETDGNVRMVAHSGLQPETLAAHDFSAPVDSPVIVARAVRERDVMHRPDLTADPLYAERNPLRTAMVDVEGARSALVVPLISGGTGIGCIWVFRRKPRAYREDEIALLQSFAAQAVIAVENVRQFRELQTRLEREAATGEVLQVINSSRDDETPVFDAILKNACKLCDAPLAYLSMVTADGAHVVSPARRGAFEKFGETLDRLRVPLHESRLVLARAIAEGRIFRVDDIADDDLYRSGDPNRVSMVEDEGARSLLVVPLVSGGVGIGSITLYRREVAPFSDDDVALVETFAAQAVIAIENVRQFRALEARTEEVQALNASLESRVEEQVGEIERMGKLKSFLPAAVADAVVSQGSEMMLKSHRALLGILFCDIRGFTAFCETAEPEETIEVLQTYHQEMGRLIAAHGAGVDHRMGDGIMVLFNDPLPCDDPAGDAVRLAMAMRAKMVELCREWKKLGHRLGFGVGVSLGYATVGMVGYEERSEYTASGTAVNLAARLCDRAEDGEILLSPRAHIAVEDDFDCESGGMLDLKGLSAPVEVMKAVAPRD